MKTQPLIKSIILLFTFVFMMACANYTVHYEDSSAGLNGGFEISKNGLPVNWLMYAPETVPEADFKIVLDTDNFIEGKQSLMFNVKECTAEGAWRSPGFTNELFDKTEGRYKLSFWVMNNGSRFSINSGGVSSKGGSMKNILTSKEQFDKWNYFEFFIDVPADEWFRVELNIFNPGVFWIDDLRVEEI